MRKVLKYNHAIVASVVLIALMILFHLSILAGIILFDYAPIDFLWGGQMKTVEQLLQFEIFSLLLSILIIFLILIKSKRLQIPKLAGVASVSIWLLFGLFSLNTIGNLLAKSNFEKLFAIVTALLAFLLLRIALEKNTNNFKK